MRKQLNAFVAIGGVEGFLLIGKVTDAQVAGGIHPPVGRAQAVSLSVGTAGDQIHGGITAGNRALILPHQAADRSLRGLIRLAAEPAHRVGCGDQSAAAVLADQTAHIDLSKAGSLGFQQGALRLASGNRPLILPHQAAHIEHAGGAVGGEFKPIGGAVGHSALVVPDQSAHIKDVSVSRRAVQRQIRQENVAQRALADAKQRSAVALLLNRKVSDFMVHSVIASGKGLRRTAHRQLDNVRQALYSLGMAGIGLVIQIQLLPEGIAVIAGAPAELVQLSCRADGHRIRRRGKILSLHGQHRLCEMRTVGGSAGVGVQRRKAQTAVEVLRNVFVCLRIRQLLRKDSKVIVARCQQIGHVVRLVFIVGDLEVIAVRDGQGLTPNILFLHGNGISVFDDVKIVPKGAYIAAGEAAGDSAIFISINLIVDQTGFAELRAPVSVVGESLQAREIIGHQCQIGLQIVGVACAAVFLLEGGLFASVRAVHCGEEVGRNHFAVGHTAIVCLILFAAEREVENGTMFGTRDGGY